MKKNIRYIETLGKANNGLPRWKYLNNKNINVGYDEDNHNLKLVRLWI